MNQDEHRKIMAKSQAKQIVDAHENSVVLKRLKDQIKMLGRTEHSEPEPVDDYEPEEEVDASDDEP
ncbi:hypothetical protein PINS_up009288 [Pythium insidiosum]|nr:hypothetical protein PINS_up009288 [Pythium insidiosum]